MALAIYYAGLSLHTPGGRVEKLACNEYELTLVSKVIV